MTFEDFFVGSLLGATLVLIAIACVVPEIYSIIFDKFKKK
jgi:hypothetical protein